MPTLIYPRCEVSDVFPDLPSLYTYDSLDLNDFRATILGLKDQKKETGVYFSLKDDIKISKYTREALARKFADIILKGDGDEED